MPEAVQIAELKVEVRNLAARLEQYVKYHEKEHATIDTAQENLGTRLEAMDTRFRSLERVMWTASGGITVIMLVLKFVKG